MTQQEVDNQIHAFADSLFDALVGLAASLDSPLRALKVVEKGPKYTVNEANETIWHRKDSCLDQLANMFTTASPQVYVRSCLS